MKRLFVLTVTAFLSHGALAPAAPPDKGSDDDLERVAKDFVTLLANGDYKKATESFDATMTRVMSPLKLRLTWNGMLLTTGSFESLGETRKEKVGAYDVVFVTTKFRRATLATKVVYDKHGKVAGLFFVPAEMAKKYEPPTYSRPNTFKEVEVTFGSDEWQLPGTVSLPKGDGPFPAVVLVHGSGPNDRDETVGANKPFKDLAGGLATLGVAVLRYDKRTKVHRTRLATVEHFTVKEETIDDALAAAEMLRKHERINSKQVYLLGHSLGGYLIPRIATADSSRSVAGFISLAGNTRPLEVLAWEQVNYVFGLDGALSKADEEKLADLKDKIEQVQAFSDVTESKPVLGAPAAYWLDLREYKPHVEAASITRPFLVLQGERDYQVTMKDFANWKETLAARDNVTFKSYPNLNHLFIAGKGKSQPAEYQKAGNVAEEVVQDIAKWVKQR